MATVKIFLEPNETQEDAEDLLIKALLHHESGDEHHEDFQQPLARDVIQFMNHEHDAMFDRMLKEIFMVIDEEA